MEALKQKGSSFTYQCKTDRKRKVVFSVTNIGECRNTHPTADIKEIKDKIEAQNHKVLRITNILDSRSKKPLPLFFIELQQQNNNDIYKIKHLLNIIINFEQPYKKR